MKPLIVFPDPVLVTLTALRTGGFLADPVVAEANPTVTRTLPERDSTTTRPAITVADDGDAGGGSRVTENATVRITVWDTDAHRAKHLARLARAYLVAYPGDALSGGFRDGTRPFTTTDPDDGTELASFVITSRLKPE